MMYKKAVIVSTLATLALAPAAPVAAGGAEAAIFGAIIGGLLVNSNNRKSRKKTKRRYYSGVSSAQRQQNKEVQTSLNYFGYPAGVVDGAIGRGTRRAISQYQSQMGYAVSGHLDEYQRNFLTGSYHRAISTGSIPPYSTIMASQGPAGLLRTYRNEQRGIQTPGVQQQPVYTNTQQQPVYANTQPQQPVYANTPAAVPVAVAPAVTPTSAPAAAPAGLPVLVPGQMARSVSQHCGEVGVLTATNGSYMTSTTVTDADLAFNEQFCLARAYATSESSQITKTIPGTSQAQLTQQCEGVTGYLAGQVAGLKQKDPRAMQHDLSVFLGQSGQTEQQLTSGGKVCLGIGYRFDDPKMALASAMMLVGAGHVAYGEIIGHHLREGFGVTANPVAAEKWITYSAEVLEQGAEPAILPGQSSERVAVLRAALRGDAPQTAVTSLLPTFGTPSE